MLKNNKFTFLGIIGIFVLVLSFTIAPTFAKADTYSQIGGATLKYGSRGTSVTALQQFLASNSDIYPAGSVTGYFGPLTKAAVIQFQLSYNLNADGIAGPNTKGKANSIIASGLGMDLFAPAINNLSVASVSGNNVNVSFSSNEPVKTAVFYDTNAINWSNWDDAAITLSTPNISGASKVDDSFSLNKQLTLSNLSANTNYNYVVTATDQSGNTSVVWPKVVRTGQ